MKRLDVLKLRISNIQDLIKKRKISFKRRKLRETDRNWDERESGEDNKEEKNKDSFGSEREKERRIVR